MEEQLIENLIEDVNITILRKDLNDYTELLSYVKDKSNNIAIDADNFDYKLAKTIANDINERVSKLQGIKKQHNIPKRIKQILNDIKY